MNKITNTQAIVDGFQNVMNSNASSENKGNNPLIKIISADKTDKRQHNHQLGRGKSHQNSSTFVIFGNILLFCQIFSLSSRIFMSFF